MISKSAGREPQSFVSFYSEVSAFLGLRNNGNRLFPISFPREFLEAGVLFYELAANVWCSVAWDIRHCAGGQRTTAFCIDESAVSSCRLYFAVFPLLMLASFFQPLGFYLSQAEFFVRLRIPGRGCLFCGRWKGRCRACSLPVSVRINQAAGNLWSLAWAWPWLAADDLRLRNGRGRFFSVLFLRETAEF